MRFVVKTLSVKLAHTCLVCERLTFLKKENATVLQLLVMGINYNNVSGVLHGIENLQSDWKQCKELGPLICGVIYMFNPSL